MNNTPLPLRNLNAPAMIKLSLLVKLATIAARTKAAFDTMNDDELAQADSEFAFKVNDPEVAALLADMRRTGLL